MTTTTALRPHSPVCWSAGGDTRIGTLLPPASDTPIGHSHVHLFLFGTRNVMTLALRPYTPTADEVARMRRWVADCGVADGGMERASTMDAAEVIAYIGQHCESGHGLFVR